MKTEKQHCWPKVEDRTPTMASLCTQDGLYVEEKHGYLSVHDRRGVIENWQLYASSLSVHLASPVAVIDSGNPSDWKNRNRVLAVVGEYLSPTQPAWHTGKGLSFLAVLEKEWRDQDNQILSLMDSIATVYCNRRIQIQLATWNSNAYLMVKDQVLIPMPFGVVNIYKHLNFGQAKKPEYELIATLTCPTKMDKFTSQARIQWRDHSKQYDWLVPKP